MNNITGAALTNWFEASPMSNKAGKIPAENKEYKQKRESTVVQRGPILTFIEFVSNRKEFRLTMKFLIEL